MLRKKKTRRRYFRTSIALLLAAVLALQGTSPLFVQAKDVMGNTPRTVDFSRPEALRSLEEAGVEEGTPQGARSGRTVSGQGEQGGRDGFEESQGGQPQEGTPAGTDETNASDKTSTDDKENPTIGTETNRPDANGTKADGSSAADVDKAGSGADADAGADSGAADTDTDADKGNDNASDSEEGKIPSDPEAEGREPEDLYPLPEEPEGELVSFDGGSRTYRTGEGQYTTVIGGYVGTYQDDGGEFQLADNTLVEPETTAYAAGAAADGAGEETDAAGGSNGANGRNNAANTATDGAAANGQNGADGQDNAAAANGQNGADTSTGAADPGFVHNKQNDYLVVLPKNITAEAGMVLVRGEDTMEIVPQGGDFSHSVVKDNAIRYNQVYDGIDVQYTVLNENIKEDIILRKPMGQEGFTYELKIPGLKAALVDNQVYIYPEDKEESEARGEARFILEAPSMEDAAGEVSVHIGMGLRTEADGRVLLTVTPDAG